MWRTLFSLKTTPEKEKTTRKTKNKNDKNKKLSKKVLWTLLTKRNMLDICLDFMIIASVKIKKNQEIARNTNFTSYPWHDSKDK